MERFCNNGEVVQAMYVPKPTRGGVVQVSNCNEDMRKGELMSQNTLDSTIRAFKKKTESHFSTKFESCRNLPYRCFLFDSE